MTGALRWCTTHGALLPLEEFGRDQRGRLHVRCRACRSSAAKAWRERNADAVSERNAQRRREYAEARGDMTRICVNPDCGRTFIAGRVDAKSCSRSCRDHLAYLRRTGRAI